MSHDLARPGQKLAAMILPPPKSEDANPSQRNPASKIAQLETPVQPMHDLSTFVSSPSNKTSESTGLGAGPSRSYAAVKHQSKARKLNLKVKKGSKAAALHPSVDDVSMRSNICPSAKTNATYSSAPSYPSVLLLIPNGRILGPTCRP